MRDFGSFSPSKKADPNHSRPSIKRTRVARDLELPPSAQHQSPVVTGTTGRIHCGSLSGRHLTPSLWWKRDSWDPGYDRYQTFFYTCSRNELAWCEHRTSDAAETSVSLSRFPEMGGRSIGSSLQGSRSHAEVRVFNA